MTHEIRTETRRVAYSATGDVLYDLRTPDAPVPATWSSVQPDVQRRAVCVCGWRGPWYATPAGLATSGERHLRRAAKRETCREHVPSADPHRLVIRGRHLPGEPSRGILRLAPEVSMREALVIARAYRDESGWAEAWVERETAAEREERGP